MSRKREPVAEIGSEDYRIVKHTHDVELAIRLMRNRLVTEYGCPRYGYSDGCADFAPGPTNCPHDLNVGKPRLTYVRIQGALPNSFAAAEGWAYSYHEYDKPGRGAFPAVVFR